jgi:hypothetical protein
MIVVAWHHLRQNGELSQNELLNNLNVKRSVFVCALLAPAQSHVRTPGRG